MMGQIRRVGLSNDVSPVDDDPIGDGSDNNGYSNGDAYVCTKSSPTLPFIFGLIGGVVTTMLLTSGKERT